MPCPPPSPPSPPTALAKCYATRILRTFLCSVQLKFFKSPILNAPPPHHAPNSTSDNDVIWADFQPQKYLPHFFFCAEKNPGKPGKIDNEIKNGGGNVRNTGRKICLTVQTLYLVVISPRRKENKRYKEKRRKEGWSRWGEMGILFKLIFDTFPPLTHGEL